PAQRRQSRTFIFTAPEVIEYVIVRIERGAERLHRQCEDLLGIVQPVTGRHGGVRREGGRYRRPVHQRIGLPLLQVIAPETLQDVGQRQHLPPPPLPLQRPPRPPARK